MSIALRTAEVVWDGTLAGGTGALSSASGALKLPVTWARAPSNPVARPAPRS